VRVTQHQRSDLGTSRFTPPHLLLVSLESFAGCFSSLPQFDSDCFDSVSTFEGGLESVVERSSDKDPFLVICDETDEQVDNS